MSKRPGAMTVAMQAVALKPAGPKVLRIGIFRDGKVVEERIIRKRENVLIGTSEDNHFIIKSNLLPQHFELFQLVGEHYILNFLEAMQGRIALPGGTQNLSTLRQTGGARVADSHYQVKLADTSRGNIIIGDTKIFFEFVAPLPVTPKPRLPASTQGGLFQRIDWPFTANLIFAYILLFGFILYAEQVDWEVEQGSQAIPEQLARLIFVEPREPEKQEPSADEGPKKTQPKPEQIEKEEPLTDDEEPAGEKPSAETEARIVEQAARQAETMLLGAFGEEGALADVLREGAATGNAAEVLAQASGVGVADTSANDKLRIRSGGAQGSGQQAGLGTLASSAGAGKSAAEGGPIGEREIRGKVDLSGGGDIGGSGDFDPALVVSQIKKRLSAIKRCYENELRRNPKLNGKVTVEFTIQEQGNVTNVKAIDNSTGSQEVGSCVTEAVSRFRFTPGPDGGSVSFRYPFVFAAQQ